METAVCATMIGRSGTLKFLLCALVVLFLLAKTSHLQSVENRSVSFQHILNRRKSGCTYGGRVLAVGAVAHSEDPCLNCTCDAVTLSVSCHLRVCPQYSIPPPPGCFLITRHGSCCSELVCERELRREERQRGNARSENEQIDQEIAKSLKNNGSCVLDGTVYADGSAMLTSSECQHCFCIRGRQQCVRPQCGLHEPGCRPQFRSLQGCCPSNYVCNDVASLTRNLTEISSTTTTTTEPPNVSECTLDGVTFAAGERILNSSNSCQSCFCLRGQVRCAPIHCSPTLEDCIPVFEPGTCCPVSYNCSSNSHELNHTRNSAEDHVVETVSPRTDDIEERSETAKLAASAFEKQTYQPGIEARSDTIIGETSSSDTVLHHEADQAPTRVTGRSSGGGVASVLGKLLGFGKGRGSFSVAPAGSNGAGRRAVSSVFPSRWRSGSVVPAGWSGANRPRPSASLTVPGELPPTTFRLRVKSEGIRVGAGKRPGNGAAVVARIDPLSQAAVLSGNIAPLKKLSRVSGKIDLKRKIGLLSDSVDELFFKDLSAARPVLAAKTPFTDENPATTIKPLSIGELKLSHIKRARLQDESVETTEASGDHDTNYIEDLLNSANSVLSYNEDSSAIPLEDLIEASGDFPEASESLESGEQATLSEEVNVDEVSKQNIASVNNDHISSFIGDENEEISTEIIQNSPEFLEATQENTPGVNVQNEEDIHIKIPSVDFFEDKPTNSDLKQQDEVIQSPSENGVKISDRSKSDPKSGENGQIGDSNIDGKYNGNNNLKLVNGVEHQEEVDDVSLLKMEHRTSEDGTEELENLFTTALTNDHNGPGNAAAPSGDGALKKKVPSKRPAILPQLFSAILATFNPSLRKKPQHRPSSPAESGPPPSSTVAEANEKGGQELDSPEIEKSNGPTAPESATHDIQQMHVNSTADAPEAAREEEYPVSINSNEDDSTTSKTRLALDVLHSAIAEQKETPSSVPNLRIIPFVAADAVVNRYTDEIAREKLNNRLGISPTNLQPNDNIDTDTCVVNGSSYQNGELVEGAAGKCQLCRCYFGRLVCQDFRCPGLPAGCRAVSKPGACCPRIVCDTKFEKVPVKVIAISNRKPEDIAKLKPPHTDSDIASFTNENIVSGVKHSESGDFGFGGNKVILKKPVFKKPSASIIPPPTVHSEGAASFPFRHRVGHPSIPARVGVPLDGFRQRRPPSTLDILGFRRGPGSLVPPRFPINAGAAVPIRRPILPPRLPPVTTTTRVFVPSTEDITESTTVSSDSAANASSAAIYSAEVSTTTPAVTDQMLSNSGTTVLLSTTEATTTSTETPTASTTTSTTTLTTTSTTLSTTTMTTASTTLSTTTSTIASTTTSTTLSTTTERETSTPPVRTATLFNRRPNRPFSHLSLALQKAKLRDSIRRRQSAVINKAALSVQNSVTTPIPSTALPTTSSSTRQVAKPVTASAPNTNDLETISDFSDQALLLQEPPPPIFAGLPRLSGCNIFGRMYRVNTVVRELSDNCSVCRCTYSGVTCQQRC